MAGGLAVAATLGSGRLALARTGGEARLVVVVLRGGLDGLSAVPPLGDPDYRRLRPSLALAEPGEPLGARDLDGFFGLHPELIGLYAWFREKELLIVHGVASPYRDRSHFDAQNVLESGAATPHALRDGWLNRALAGFGSAGPGLGLAIGQTPPLLIQGTVPVASWAPRGAPEMPADVLAMIQALYRTDPLLGPALEEGLRTRAMARGSGGERRGQGELDELGFAAGSLLAEPEGPRIAVMEAAGWDTHAFQGAGEGQIAWRLRDLDNALWSMRDGLGEAAWRHTLVLCVTEFGRTVAENGTRGTDHGTASVAFVTGGAANGGQVLTRWPGLAPDRLHQGRDLAPVVDMRSIFKSALIDHMGLPREWIDRAVFPDSAEVGPIRHMVRA